MSTNNSRQTQLELGAADQSLLDGLTKNASTLTSFTIASQVVPTATITQALQARLKALSASQTARAAWQTAVKAETDERASTKALIAGVRQALQVMYSGAADTLAQYGLKPRKPRTPLTSEQKVAAAAKAKATRDARGTTGSVQKKAVKGNVTGVTITPTASPQPSAPVVTSSPTAGAPSPVPTAVPAPRAGT